MFACVVLWSVFVYMQEGPQGESIAAIAYIYWKMPKRQNLVMTETGGLYDSKEIVMAYFNVYLLPDEIIVCSLFFFFS